MFQTIFYFYRTSSLPSPVYSHLGKASNVLFFLTVFSLAICAPCLIPPSHAAPRTLQELADIKENIFETGVIHGDIPAIYGPTYISTQAASIRFNDEDQVFVVFFPSGPKLYPQKLLAWHEVVNESIQGEPYIITYAPITGSMAAYSARIDDQLLSFDHQGSLYNANSVLIDRNTGSLWVQMLGMAFEGPLLGRGLNPLPAWWTTWKMARKAYPNAPVLAPPRGSRKPYNRDPYGSYVSDDSYYSNELIMFPLTADLDPRMHPKSRVLGFEYDNSFVAIDEASVAKAGLINFYNGLTPLLAVYDTRIGVVRIFNRTVWNKDTLFIMKDGVLTDVDSQTEWSFDGKAVKGKLLDATLTETFGIHAFWFAWAAIHPETATVPGANDVPAEALVKGHETKGLTPKQ